MKTQTPKIAKTRAPKGFHFKIFPTYNYVCVEIHNSNGQMIGQIQLDKGRRNRYYTHSWLHEDYRGMGFGTKLYARAIQWCLEQGYKVSSSSNTSELAQRVWEGNGLRQKFDIKKRSKMYYGERRPLWHAYPKQDTQPKSMASRKTGKYVGKSKHST
jgi:GNAT superfamily N-acetyltransferase